MKVHELPIGGIQSSSHSLANEPPDDLRSLRYVSTRDDIEKDIDSVFFSLLLK